MLDIHSILRKKNLAHQGSKYTKHKNISEDYLPIGKIVTGVTRFARTKKAASIMEANEHLSKWTEGKIFCDYSVITLCCLSLLIYSIYSTE